MPMLEENQSGTRQTVRQLAVLLRTLRIKGVIEDFAFWNIPACGIVLDMQWIVKGRELEITLPGLLVQIDFPGAMAGRLAALSTK